MNLVFLLYISDVVTSLTNIFGPTIFITVSVIIISSIAQIMIMHDPYLKSDLPAKDNPSYKLAVAWRNTSAIILVISMFFYVLMPSKTTILSAGVAQVTADIMQTDTFKQASPEINSILVDSLKLLKQKIGEGLTTVTAPSTAGK